MNFLDLLTMSVNNLWRRKLRTALTVLGVVIGTAAIVVMVSLGIALNKSYLEDVEQSGGLTTINVYSGNEYAFFEGGSQSDDTEKIELTDDVIEELAQLDHVEFVSPVLTSNIIIKQGLYQADLYVRAMSSEALNKLDIPLAYGSVPQDGEELRYVLGNQAITNFYNAKTNSYPYWDTGEVPDVDLQGDFFVIYDVDAYYQTLWGDASDPESGTTIKPPKKYIMSDFSLVSGGLEEYNQFSSDTYANIDAFKAQLKKVFKNKAIPGQPTTKSGKPYKYWVYNEAYVKVDHMDNVTDVQKVISEMGLQPTSNAEWVESAQKQSRSIQAVLGGIGAVSLFVASIGIANTMMMSIYERTKEIGIIKVLGCSLGNIRTLFLLEAAFIGLIGGILGLILSYGISALMNQFMGSMMSGMMGSTSSVSVIPPWLSLFALSISVLVGILSGFFPALKAMKLSPLSAIKTE
ncbi:MAG: ABC transporter permease [Lachnospiraceae bacterium]|nr:ABC transporter permease [Lachnospiraceae bacterium]